MNRTVVLRSDVHREGEFAVRGELLPVADVSGLEVRLSRGTSGNRTTSCLAKTPELVRALGHAGERGGVGLGTVTVFLEAR